MGPRVAWTGAATAAVLVLGALGAWLMLSGADAEPSALTTTNAPSRPAAPQSSSAQSSGAAQAGACARGASAVLSAAIDDIVAGGDVGKRYQRATREYGGQSEEWRLASVLFAPVSAQLTAKGAASAKTVAETLVKDACTRLHDDKGQAGEPDLQGAEPITVPTSPTTEPAPTARSCEVLEESTTAFPGTFLTPDNRGKYKSATLMVQSRLNWLGWACIPEDGDYGLQTQRTVKLFQESYGLVIDGEVGPQTWNALFGLSDY